MSAGFDQYVETAKRIAGQNGLSWEMRLDESGNVRSEDRWDLTKLTGVMPPPCIWLSEVSTGTPALPHLNRMRKERGDSEIPARPLSERWADLRKAVVIEQTLIRRNSAAHALAVANGVSQIAAAAEREEPWDISAATVKDAYCAALLVGNSGKQANNLKMSLRTVWERNLLHDGPPLIRFCDVAGLPNLECADAKATELGRRETSHFGKRQILASPSDRKSPEKLPDPKSLEEFARIVLTRTPHSFSDAVRLQAWRIKLFTPFRLGETVSIPFDCLRTREYYDADGLLAGEHGGISRSLELRHFMEKSSKSRTVNGKALVEERLHVPREDADFITNAVETARRLTEPLRRTLRLQTNTGRQLPMFDPQEQRPAWELFLHVSGSVRLTDVSLPNNLVDKYYRTFEFALLDEMLAAQFATGAPFSPVMRYFLKAAGLGLSIRDKEGRVFGSDRKVDWRSARITVGELEEHIKRHAPTKLSERRPGHYQDGGEVNVEDLLFLMPIRNVVEGRNSGVLDVRRYASIGRLSANDMMLTVSKSRNSLFNRYDYDNLAAAMSLKTHVTRHMLTSELLRGGVSDAAVAKHANREVVATNRVYDHRNLEEMFAAGGFDVEAEDLALKTAGTAVRLIKARMVAGPVVDEFAEVQRTRGDVAALQFLVARAPGFHSTPFGFCIANFATDPCPKHLQCLGGGGCRDLVRTGSSTEIDNIKRHLSRTRAAIEKLEATPERKRGPGWNSQLSSANQAVTNLEKALAAKGGDRPFPNGEEKFRRLGGSTVLD